tara:strand:- start:394 stop:1068 length:675 start_codon:yes stop_codon:yes gene_type:complete
MFQNNLMMSAASISAAANVTLASYTQSGDNALRTVYTFSDQALGDAAADRKIVVITAGGSASAAVSSITIAGVSAALVLDIGTSETNGEMWQADVPTGTSGTIVVTYGSAIHNTGIGTFRITGAGTGPSAPSDTATDTDSDPIELTITVPKGGVCIAGACDDSTSTHTWAELTEVYDTAVSGSRMHTGALLNSETLETDLPVTCTFSNQTGSQRTGLAASWAPA